MGLVEHTARFAEVMAGPEVRLDAATLLIAAHARGDLDLAAELTRLDVLAAGVTEPSLDGLRDHLFGRLGFTGDRAAYHDPRNSLLDAVLERRTGIPITLSVVMIEVGRRVGVPLAGVGMPGHFLVRDEVDPDVFVDPYAGGAVLDAPAARSIFERLHPRVPWEDRFLEPTDAVAIVTRVLNNLVGAYRRAGDRAALAWVLDLRTRLPAAGEAEQREHALALASLGRYREAAARFDALEGDEASRTAARLRARLN